MSLARSLSVLEVSHVNESINRKISRGSICISTELNRRKQTETVCKIAAIYNDTLWGYSCSTGDTFLTNNSHTGYMSYTWDGETVSYKHCTGTSRTL